MDDLEQRYRTLSRQFHPDYFYNASAAERRASLERSSYLNDAYRALKNPASRIEYLLKIEGYEPRVSGHEPRAERRETPVPAGLLEEVFALNEELDEVRALRASGAPAEEWKRRLERARQPIEHKKAEHDADIDRLSGEWDALADGAGGDETRRRILGALGERFLERNYISNLLASIAREISE